MNRFLGTLAAVLVAAFSVSTAQADVGYDKGFWLKSSDGNNALKVNGYTQTQFTYNNLDGAPDTTGFSIPHAKLTFHGHALNPDLHYRMQLEMTTGGAVLEDAHAAYQYRENGWIMGGQFKVPFSRQAAEWSSDLSFIGRSASTRFFATNGAAAFANRDIGVQFAGMWENVHYNLGIVNGAGQNAANGPDKEMSYFVHLGLGEGWNSGEGDAGRSEEDVWGAGLAYYLQEGLGVAGNTLLTGADALAAANVHAHRLGVDFMWRCMGTAAQAEFFYGIFDPAGAFSRQDAYGGYGQLNHLFTDMFDAGIRFDFFDPDTDIGDNHQFNIQAVGGWYFSNDHRHKLQVQYTYNRVELTSANNNQFALMWQASI